MKSKNVKLLLYRETDIKWETETTNQAHSLVNKNIDKNLRDLYSDFHAYIPRKYNELDHRAFVQTRAHNRV